MTKNSTPTPSVVGNPTPIPPKNLRLLATPTPQPCTQTEPAPHCFRPKTAPAIVCLKTTKTRAVCFTTSGNLFSG